MSWKNKEDSRCSSKNPVVVGRMEKDVNKLEALYEEGFQLGEQFVKEHVLLADK